jgi:hypothetical protein
MTTGHDDAIYIGGPQDGVVFASERLALVEVDINGASAVYEPHERRKPHIRNPSLWIFWAAETIPCNPARRSRRAGTTVRHRRRSDQLSLR